MTPAEKCAVLDAWIRRALDRLEAVDQAATRAPWWVDTAYGGIDGWQIRAAAGPRGSVIAGAGREGDGGVWERPDADATVLARSLLAAAIPMLRATLAELAKWQHDEGGGDQYCACPAGLDPRLYPHLYSETCTCSLVARRLEILRHLTSGLANVLADELLPVGALDDDERTPRP